MRGKLSASKDSNQPGKLIGMLNRMADKYSGRDADGDVNMR
jgi:hypothetical protein